MNCIKIRFILPYHKELKWKEEESIAIQLPQGSIRFTVNVQKLKELTSYSLKSDPLNDNVSDEVVRKVQNALVLSSLQHDLGLLMSVKYASGTITEYGKKLLGLDEYNIYSCPNVNPAEYL